MLEYNRLKDTKGLEDKCLYRGATVSLYGDGGGCGGGGSFSFSLGTSEDSPSGDGACKSIRDMREKMARILLDGNVSLDLRGSTPNTTILREDLGLLTNIYIHHDRGPGRMITSTKIGGKK